MNTAQQRSFFNHFIMLPKTPDPIMLDEAELTVMMNYAFNLNNLVRMKQLLDHGASPDTLRISPSTQPAMISTWSGHRHRKKHIPFTLLQTLMLPDELTQDRIPMIELLLAYGATTQGLPGQHQFYAVSCADLLLDRSGGRHHATEAHIQLLPILAANLVTLNPADPQALFKTPIESAFLAFHNSDLKNTLIKTLLDLGFKPEQPSLPRLIQLFLSDLPHDLSLAPGKHLERLPSQLQIIFDYAARVIHQHSYDELVPTAEFEQLSFRLQTAPAHFHGCFTSGFDKLALSYHVKRPVDDAQRLDSSTLSPSVMRRL